MVSTLIEQDELKARASSYAIARFALTQISRKGTKISIEDFMPYADPNAAQKQGEGIPAKTVAIMRQLVKGRALPARVEAAAIRALGGMGNG